jgi:hypothetical protein
MYLQELLLVKYHQDTIKTYWRLGRSADHANQPQQAFESYYRAARMAETTFNDLNVVKALIDDVTKPNNKYSLSEEETTTVPSNHLTHS